MKTDHLFTCPISKSLALSNQLGCGKIASCLTGKYSTRHTIRDGENSEWRRTRHRLALARSWIMEVMADRDRDDTGRARNARPRDRFGRPLPMGSAGVERIPDDLELTPAETLGYAQRLLDDGLAFNAHEVLEAAWKNGPFAERMLWQGLAQYAVGITHVQRGNARGARTLLERAAHRLTTFGPAPYGIDSAGLIAHAGALLADLGSGRSITEDRLRPRLRA